MVGWLAGLVAAARVQRVALVSVRPVWGAPRTFPPTPAGRAPASPVSWSCSSTSPTVDGPDAHRRSTTTRGDVIALGWHQDLSADRAQVARTIVTEAKRPVALVPLPDVRQWSGPER